MSGSGPRSTAGEDAEARRRRLRQQVFGDVLPDTTTDERDQGGAESGAETGAGSGAETANDAWLRSNVPPHHG